LLSSISQDEVGGSDIDVDANKSVSLKILSPDSRYNRIRVFSLFYKELYSNPEISTVFEGDNTGSDVSIVDTGIHTGGITYEEFLVFNNTTYTPNSIESKNNILFAANVKESTFQSDAIDNWDSRAYTFPESSSSTDVLVDGSYLSLSDTNWDNRTVFPLDADATVRNVSRLSTSNIYNKDLSTHSLYRRFQINSTTEGGSGPNIYYEFVNAYDNIDSSGTTKGYDINPSKQDVKGLQPNEVYRFGIVFYNNKGQSSFVKWIQDIRISPSNESAYKPTSTIRGQNRGVRFTLKNGPWEADDSIVGWQIVRVKRNFEDREVVYNGYSIPALPAHSENFCRPLIKSDDTASPSTYYHIGIPLDENEFYDWGGSSDIPELHEFISPDYLFNNSSIPENCKVQINRFCDYDSEVNTSTSQQNAYLNAKGYNLELWPEGVTSRSLLDFKKLGISYYDSGEEYNIGGSSSTSRFRNFSKTATLVTQPNDGYNLGVGGTKIVLRYDFYSNFIPSTWSLSNKRLINVDIVKDVENTRYGGITYSSRQNNTYIPYGNINRYDVLTDATYSEKFNGDTYIKMFTYLRNMYQEDYPKDWQEDDGTQEVISFPVYTSINLDYRRDDINKYIFKGDEIELDSDGQAQTMLVQETVQKGIEIQPEYYDEKIGDLYIYNSVYSKQNEAKKFFPKPLDFEDNPTVDSKIIASEKKFSGESIDSWSIFKANNFIEVESDYGSITKLKRFKDQLYCFQPNAISLIAVNDRSLISDDSGLQLSLGTGGVLERYDYLSTSTGLQRSSALAESREALYYIDEYSKEFRILAGPNSQDLSRIKGFYSKLNELLPSTKITTGFDSKFNEIYLNFDNETWIYNEIIQSVIGKFDVNSNNYFNLEGNLYSIKDDTLRLHNDSGSKLGNKSYITLLINPNSNIINSFDNLDFRTDTSINPKEGNSNEYVKYIRVTYSAIDPDATPSLDLYDYDDNPFSTNTSVTNLEGTGESLLISVQNQDYFRPKTLDFSIFTSTTFYDLKVEVTLDGETFHYIYYQEGGFTGPLLDLSTLIPELDLKNVGTLNRIIYENSYIDPITVDAKLSDPNKTVSHLARAFRTQVPQTSDGNRFVDSHLLATFEYDNISNNQFKLHDIITYYRETKI